MIEVTNSAIAEFKNVLNSDDRRGMGIKIKAIVSQSCCSCGPSQNYEMDLVKEGAAGDVMMEKDTVRFYLDPETEKLMEGFEIDFSEDHGFIVKDNSAPSSCGCGDGGSGGSCCG